jgi:hypothetical protein
VRGRLEVQDDPAAVPAARDPYDGLVPDVAEVVADGRVGRDVVETGGHGHVAGVRQRAGEPSRGAPLAGRVERELPDAVDALALAGGGVLGS